MATDEERDCLVSQSVVLHGPRTVSDTAEAELFSFGLRNVSRGSNCVWRSVSRPLNRLASGDEVTLMATHPVNWCPICSLCNYYDLHLLLLLVHLDLVRCGGELVAPVAHQRREKGGTWKRTGRGFIGATLNKLEDELSCSSSELFSNSSFSSSAMKSYLIMIDGLDSPSPPPPQKMKLGRWRRRAEPRISSGWLWGRTNVGKLNCILKFHPRIATSR